MNLKEINEKYGKVVLIVISIVVWFFVVLSIFVNGYLVTWYHWHVPAKEPPFIDFRLIPSAAETFRSGIDPSVSNPNDPRQHVFNYPKIWYIFFYTGITQADSIWISILLIILFFMIVFSFPEKLLVTDAILILFVIFSPAAMLLYERGNVDLVFFTLCGLAILLVSFSPAWTVLVLSIGAIFKFFPFFGVGIFLQEDRKKFYKYFFISLLIFFLYIALNFDSFKAAWKLTERGTIISYGVYIIFDLLKAYFNYYLLKILSPGNVVIALKYLPHLSAGILLLATFLLGIKTKKTLRADSIRNLVAFQMGALIYIGTFLLGNNWDYRLSFLIFTIPQFSRWMFSLHGTQRWLVIGVFLSLLSSCWFMFFNHYVMIMSDYAYELQMKIFDEVVNWTLFVGLAYLFVASAPQWFQNFEWFSPLKSAKENQ